MSFVSVWLPVARCPQLSFPAIEQAGLGNCAFITASIVGSVRIGLVHLLLKTNRGGMLLDTARGRIRTGSVGRYRSHASKASGVALDAGCAALIVPQTRASTKNKKLPRLVDPAKVGVRYHPPPPENVHHFSSQSPTPRSLTGRA